MAGRGPLPKPASRRANRVTKDPGTTTLRFERAEPPTLPDQQPDGVPWPVATRRWWQVWVDSPQAEHFGSTDWQELLSTALLHARLWSGETGVAAELRLRVAKFGATPEDRARLRMQFADADEKDAKRQPAGASSRALYGNLRAVGAADD